MKNVYKITFNNEFTVRADSEEQAKAIIAEHYATAFDNLDAIDDTIEELLGTVEVNQLTDEQSQKWLINNIDKKEVEEVL
jgi:predicted small metal-binding protein